MKLNLQWICKNEGQLDDFIEKIKSDWDRTKAIMIEASEVGEKRSDSANSLFHIWCRQLEKAMPYKEENGEITPNSADDIKRLAKTVWGATAKKRNPFSGKMQTILKSTKHYDSGEMLFLMSSLQAWAAERGIMLVSSGEYARLKNENA